jgi:predicted peroxiredoxin
MMEKLVKKRKVTKKRETQEQMIRRVIAENHTSHIVKNCQFNGVKFDEAATETITTIAEGLVENAKALGQLAYVLKASNVEIETLVKI